MLECGNHRLSMRRLGMDCQERIERKKKKKFSCLASIVSGRGDKGGFAPPGAAGSAQVGRLVDNKEPQCSTAAAAAAALSVRIMLPGSLYFVRTSCSEWVQRVARLESLDCRTR